MDELMGKHGPELLFAVANHLDQSGWAEQNHAMDLVREIYAAVSKDISEGLATTFA